MEGKIDIHVEYDNNIFDLSLKRTITCIVGDSGTGKTLFAELIKEREEKMKLPNAVYNGLIATVDCKVPVYVISSIDSIDGIDNTKDCVYIIDENVCNVLNLVPEGVEKLGVAKESVLETEIDSEELKKRQEAYTKLSRKVTRTSKHIYANSYFILICREPVLRTAISIYEMYTMNPEDLPNDIVHYSLCPAFTNIDLYPLILDHLMTEGCGSDYQFFKKSMLCTVSSVGSRLTIADTLLSKVIPKGYKNIMIVADGASLGHEIYAVKGVLNANPDIGIYLYAPESFEWLVLKSGLFKVNEDMLVNTQDYMDSKDWSSWESFYTQLLVDTLALHENKNNHRFCKLVKTNDGRIVKRYPNTLKYSKSVGENNEFVNIVLLSKEGIKAMYSEIGDIENYRKDE